MENKSGDDDLDSENDAPLTVEEAGAQLLEVINESAEGELDEFFDWYSQGCPSTEAD